MMTRALLCLWVLAALLAAQTSPRELMRRACQQMPISEPAVDGQEVEVRDGRSNRPVANADVLVMCLPKDPEARQAAGQAMEARLLQRAKSGASAAEARLRVTVEMSKRYRTGADGKVVVAVDDGDLASVMVAHGDRFARGSPGQPIVLHAARIVPVRVVDWRGRPVHGARVSIGDADHSFLAGGQAKTAKDGTCRIAMRGARPSKSMVAAVETVSSRRIEAPFDGQSPPTKPLQIQLPKLGKVRVIVYGPDESPLPLVQQITLSLDREERHGRLSRMRHWTSRPDKLEADGAMFDFVELGASVIARVRLKGSTQDLEFRGKGPTRPGELVVLEGRTNLGAPVVTARVLDLEGQPLCNAQLHVLYRFDEEGRGEGSASYSSVATDPEGRIRLTFRKGSTSVYLFRRGGRKITEHLGTAHLEAAAYAPGMQDGGDLQLKLAPVVGRGRLVDDAGKPVAGVRLQAAITQLNGGYGGSGQRKAYEHRVRTDADGRFEIRECKPLGDEIELRLHHDELTHGDGKLILALDGKEEVFKLSRAGRIQATWEPGLGNLRPQIVLRNHDTGALFDIVLKSGVLQSGPLPPGIYDLQLGDHRRNYVIEKVEAPAGGRATDPRLLPIRWKQWFQPVHVKVVDEQGAPVENALIWTYLYRKNGRSGSGTRTDKDGEARLLADLVDCDLCVVVEGYETVHKIAPAAEVVVKLKRLAPVELSLAGLPDLPPGVRIAWTARPDQNPGRWSDHEKEGELRKGRATLIPSTRGKWTVSLKLRYSYPRDMDRDIRRQIADELRGELPTVEFDTSKPTGEPIEHELDADAIADLKLRFDTIREVLRSHAKGKGRL